MKQPSRHYWLVLGSLSGVLSMFILLPSSISQDKTAQLTASALRRNPDVELASCSLHDEKYGSLFFRTEKFANWADEYHGKVQDIVEEYLEPITDIECTKPEILPVRSTDILFSLASTLAPWNTPAERANLDREDVGFVLLEFLRVYECALITRRTFLTVYLRNELQQKVDSGELPSEDLENYRYNDLLATAEADLLVINAELDTARPTLEKVLHILAGTTRLGMLDAELQCMQRASLDLRNALSLAADTSACLPRIWDARDVLRDSK